MVQNSTHSSSDLCLLCRSKHGQKSLTESNCYDSYESCESYNPRTSSFQSQSMVNKMSPPFSSPPSSPSLSAVGASDDYEYNIITKRSNTRRTIMLLPTSTLVWMCVFATLIVVSSAATIGSRIHGQLDAHSEIIREDSARDGLTTDVIDEYLEKFGYYHHEHHPEGVQADSSDVHPSIVHSVQHTEAERDEALGHFQRFFHLGRSGHLDEEMKQIMSAKRCGVQDIPVDDDDDDDDDDEEEENGSDVTKETTKANLVTERQIQVIFPGQNKRRKKRFAVAKYRNGVDTKWRTDRLTWRIEGFSSQLSRTEQKQTIRRALAVWGEVIPIRLEEHTGPGEPDIRVLFARGEHGPADDPVFDGRNAKSNTLAHAWGPHYNPKGFPGDVHFDEDDDYSKASELFIVAVHELGHSFGLLHSEDRASIMYPIYQNIDKLGLDDLEAVDYLYGHGSDQSWRVTQSPRSRKIQRKYMTVKPQRVTRPPPRGVKTCDGIVLNAFLPDPAPEWKNFFIAVSGDRVYRLSPRGAIVRSQPLQDVFPDLPESPDVGLSVLEDKTIIFIKGERLWAYKEGSLINDFPRSIKEMGFPEQPRFSISLQDVNGNHKPLLFGKKYWWTFDSKASTIERYEPISDFSRDLPEDVLYVAQWSDRRLYVIRNESYVVLDSIQRSKTHLRPIDGRPSWLGDLCMHIKTPPTEPEYTVEIVFACLAVSCLLIALGIYAFFTLRKRFGR